MSKLAPLLKCQVTDDYRPLGKINKPWDEVWKFVDHEYAKCQAVNFHNRSPRLDAEAIMNFTADHFLRSKGYKIDVASDYFSYVERKSDPSRRLDGALVKLSSRNPLDGNSISLISYRVVHAWGVGDELVEEGKPEGVYVGHAVVLSITQFSQLVFNPDKAGDMIAAMRWHHLTI